MLGLRTTLKGMTTGKWEINPKGKLEERCICSSGRNVELIFFVSS